MLRRQVSRPIYLPNIGSHLGSRPKGPLSGAKLAGVREVRLQPRPTQQPWEVLRRVASRPSKASLEVFFDDELDQDQDGYVALPLAVGGDVYCIPRTCLTPAFKGKMPYYSSTKGVKWSLGI